MDDLTNHLVDLVRSASTDLQADVQSSLEKARDAEAPGSAARGALDTILENVRMSRKMGKPICQDTGTPIFYVWYPAGWSQLELRKQIAAAVRTATEKAYLRPNAVEALSGKNSGDNTGVDFPAIHFEEWDHDYVKIGLMLKGGGSENCGCQFSVPSPEFPASRDMKGVRKAVLTAAQKAQGLGCAPGILGVGIGGDRASSMVKAKEQFFRPLGDVNPDAELDKMEKQLYREINELGIGPMGFGGNTTVLGVKMAQLHRVPASFFVSVGYMCWADRRTALVYKDGKATLEKYNPIAG
ncbi:MAG: fumarate hydratase [Phycisphaerales bacterium]|nr:MAG: fumarate hydratase [Phycisphaerales bacterium]